MTNSKNHSRRPHIHPAETIFQVDPNNLCSMSTDIAVSCQWLPEQSINCQAHQMPVGRCHKLIRWNIYGIDLSSRWMSTNNYEWTSRSFIISNVSSIRVRLFAVYWCFTYEWKEIVIFCHFDFCWSPSSALISTSMFIRRSILIRRLLFSSSNCCFLFVNAASSSWWPASS